MLAKIDPDLRWMVRLAKDQALLPLYDAERARLAAHEEQVIAARNVLRGTQAGSASAAATALRRLRTSTPVPFTAALHVPGRGPAAWAARTRLPEMYVSALIVLEPPAETFRMAGVRVRTRAGRVWTAFVALSAVESLERSPRVRQVQLARALGPDLDEALQQSEIELLHAHGHGGAGVIVAVVDDYLDWRHPDFRASDGSTRVRYLWDQTLTPLAGESGPPTGLLRASSPYASYGVEYTGAQIDAALASAAPFSLVRHEPLDSHGTAVTGCAAGNGRAQEEYALELPGTPASARAYAGAAPEADLVFVRHGSIDHTSLLADSTAVLDACAYVFARAALLGRPCVLNLSMSDNQGAHDGTSPGEQYLDELLAESGRAITLSAGNAHGTGAHGTGWVKPTKPHVLVCNYHAAAPPSPALPTASDALEVWFDGEDRFRATLTAPDGTVLTPVEPDGEVVEDVGTIQVQVTSWTADPGNGDGCVRVRFLVPPGDSIPLGDWKLELAPITVVSGEFQAWIDRNNVGYSGWKPPTLVVKYDKTTLGSPACAAGPITVGNHRKKTGGIGDMHPNSGRGPTRDARIKPDIATVGTAVTAPLPIGWATPLAVPYGLFSGTSASAPIVAGACAIVFECRGAGLTCAEVKEILKTDAIDSGAPGFDPAYGFGALRAGGLCAAEPEEVVVETVLDPGRRGGG